MTPERWNSGARETAITRQWPCIQETIPEPSLGNETPSNNGGTIEGSVFYVVCAVFYAVHPEAIWYLSPSQQRTS
jgi:hypothetical protein